MSKLASIASSLLRRQSMGTEIPIGSVTLPFSAVLGIAVGGSLVLFTAITLVIFVAVRRKHKAAMRLIVEANQRGTVDPELRNAIKSTRPQPINLGKRSSNPFLPLDGPIPTRGWPKPTIQPSMQDPPMATAKRLSAHRGFFQVTGARDSWPLVSNIPLALLPGRDKMTPSQVAPPGYIIKDKPKRSSSRLSKRSSVKTITKRNSVSSVKEESRSKSPVLDPYGPPASPHNPNMQRRATSENQLSTILRSTSQRLKEAHRHSMSRTLSTIGRFPGLPPVERLPTPPTRLPYPTESREALVEKKYPESPDSSVYDFLRRTPSPEKEGKKSNLNVTDLSKSPTPSNESKDSLCDVDTPDLVIPSGLSSPTKRGSRVEQRHKMRISSAEMTAILKKSRTSVSSAGEALNMKSHSGSQRGSSTLGDPFYSTVKSAKPVIPDMQGDGPRPYYMRKATFGHEASTERPDSFCSPLRDVSGNIQPIPIMDPRSPTTDSPEQVRNPFQWSPQEAMTTRATQTSPKSPSRRKGHKRSNVVRVSGLPIPRPQSTVEVVPEEEEEDSPLKLIIPRQTSIRILESIKSPTHTSSASSSRGHGMYPPTSAVFEPRLNNVPDLSPCSDNSTPILGIEDTTNGRFSPVYSLSSYHTDPLTSPLFAVDNLPPPNPKRHARSYSTGIMQQQHQIFSFPPPTPSLSQNPSPIFPPPYQVQAYSQSMPGMTSILHSSTPQPAPPLLTMPVPAHLNGPRQQPPRRSISTRSHPRDSIAASIFLLRRMNSEVSSYSIMSSSSIDTSTSPPITQQPRNPTPLTGDGTARFSYQKDGNVEDRGRSRGSMHYLSMGMSAAARERTRHTRPRDSHRVYKERLKNRDQDKPKNDFEKELTPVREVSSPPSVHGLGIMFRNEIPGNGITPPRSNLDERVTPRKHTPTPLKTQTDDAKDEVERAEREQAPTPPETHIKRRFSKLTPTAKSQVTRRESKMEHPSPQTPTNFGLGILGLAGQRLMGLGNNSSGKDNKGDGHLERSDSLGLYDKEGFLISPIRKDAGQDVGLE